MSARDRLPDRRRNVTQSVTFNDQVFTVCVGVDDAGVAREVFVDGQRSGSQLQAFIDDCCILISIALQHGIRPEAMAHSLGTLPAWSEAGEIEVHASPIGAICEVLKATEEAALVWDCEGSS